MELVLNFVWETMQKLSNYREQIQTYLWICPMRKCCKFIKTFAFFSYSLQKDLIEIIFFRIYKFFSINQTSRSLQRWNLCQNSQSTEWVSTFKDQKWRKKNPPKNAPYNKYIYRPYWKWYQCIDETTNKKAEVWLNT